MNRKDIRHYLKLSGRIIIDGIYPRGCVVCGTPLEFYKRNESERMHEDCAGLLKPVEGAVCGKCGKKVESGKAFCADCSSNERIFDGAVSAFEYNNSLKESIYRFKYKNKREYASSFAFMMVKNNKRIIEYWEPDVIMPVPMHPEKKKVRGYNQAELLAGEMAAILKIDMDAESLIRKKMTTPLKELDTKGRYKNLDGAFGVKGSLEGKKVLLTDDIYTTGATFDSCAHALKKAGAKRVYGTSLCIGQGF